MSNEPLLEVFIDIFSKHCKFVLWQIVDGFEWKLHSFHKINGAIVWLMFKQGVYIFLLKHIFEFLVPGRNFMWTWFNIWWKKNVNQECISFHGNFHESFCSNEQRLGAPRPSCTTKASLLLQSFHVWVSHSRTSCCGISKWKFLVCQSIHGLCRTSQDNLMMTRFLGDEMTLKTTLLVWEPTLTFLMAWFHGSLVLMKNFEHQWPQPTLVCSFPLKPTYIVTPTPCP